MDIHIYAKITEPLSVFDDVIGIIKSENDDIYITSENRRSFRELEKLRDKNSDSIIVVSSLSSLGLNNADISSELSCFVNRQVMLVICDITSTYEYGVSQPMNQAILKTILQSILSNNNNIEIFRKSNCGRAKLPFPDNWDELYEKWDNKEISSKQFIELSGLKKATFYNLLTQYKETQEENIKYLIRYKSV